MTCPKVDTWVTVPDCPGYEVSIDGEVQSLDRIVHYKDGRIGFYQGKVLEQTPVPTGSGKLYLTVTLTNASGRRKNWRVGNLVLTAHVGPKPFPSAVARHLNDDQFDNRLANLAWGTQSQNMFDRYRNAR